MSETESTVSVKRRPASDFCKIPCYGSWGDVFQNPFAFLRPGTPRASSVSWMEPRMLRSTFAFLSYKAYLKLPAHSNCYAKIPFSHFGMNATLASKCEKIMEKLSRKLPVRGANAPNQM